MLLNRADAGIARDYSAYRAANRDKLRGYLNDFVVPKTRRRTSNDQTSARSGYLPYVIR